MKVKEKKNCESSELLKWVEGTGEKSVEKSVEKRVDQCEQRMAKAKSIIQYFQNVSVVELAEPEKSKQFNVKTTSNVRHSGEKLNEKTEKVERVIKNGGEMTSFVQKERQLKEKVKIWDDFYEKKKSDINKGGQNPELLRKRVGQKTKQCRNQETNQTVKKSEILRGSDSLNQERAENV